MTLFEAFFLAHLVGDFLFQTSWMAKYKAERWVPLLTHVTVYTAVVTFAGWLMGGVSIWVVVIVFISHVILDRRGFVRWWTRRIQGVTQAKDMWLMIVADQIFHLLVLALVVKVNQWV